MSPRHGLRPSPAERAGYTDRNALQQEIFSSPTDTVPDDAISLGDHRIETSDAFCTFECEACETKFEVPNIFQKSGGFELIIYQLYILGSFEDEPCTGTSTLMLEEAHEKYGHPGSIDIAKKHGDRIYTTTDGRSIYYYDGSPKGMTYWMMDGESHLLQTQEVVNKLDKLDAKEFYTKVERDGHVPAPMSYRTTTTTTSSGGGIPKDPLDSSDDDNDDRSHSDISAKEKFASKMLDRMERGDRKT